MAVHKPATSPPKEDTPTVNDSVVKLVQPGSFEGPAHEKFSATGRELCSPRPSRPRWLHLVRHADLETDDGRARVVRHGHSPEREIMTGIGPVAVQQPRVRDRVAKAADPDRIRFTSALLPPYARRTKSLDVLLPILYLRSISTGDFAETLAAFGKDAPGLSATTISRLKEAWTDEHTRWKKRDLSARRYVYVWADSIYVQATAGGREAVHPGADRRHTGRQEGAARLHGRRPRALRIGVSCCST